MKKLYTSFLLVFLFLTSFTSFSQIVNANNDAVTISNTVSAPQVVLNDVLSNDTVNGIAITVNNVTITQISSTSSIFSIEPNGNVMLNSNPVPTGTYQLEYQICLNNAPNNCDTAMVTISVVSSIIDAVDDVFVFDTNGLITTPSVLFNDTINGVPVTPNNVNVTPISVPSWFTFYQDGTITNYPNTPSGTYTIVYQICEITNPTNCDVGVVTIVVNNNPLSIGLVGTYNDFNNDGFVNVGDVVNYQITLTNNGSTVMTNLTACQYNMDVSGGTLATLDPGTSNSTFFTGVHVITQAEINAGNIFGFLCICGDSGVQNCIDGTNTPLNISNGMKLQAFIDSNSNGIKDASENFYPGGSFNYTVNGGTITNLYSSNGINYLYESNPTTTYNFSYTTPNAYYSCPTTYSNITVPNGSGITTYNFPVIATPYNDLAIFVYQYGAPPRPGFTYSNYVYYTNNGNQTIPSSTITFTNSTTVSIINTSPSTTITATGFTYTFTNLAPGQSGYIIVNMQVPIIPIVNLGDLVTNNVSITIPSGDVNTANNTSAITQTVVGSYDPNDKQETHGRKIVHSTFTSNDYLTYTIQFENTGTAEAVNIRVNDVLDADLDQNSIRMVNASHPYILERVGSTLNWKFNGINLPPSVANTQIGHGSITFQIKPKPGYAIGDIIPNTANIYFDFNPAIVTNTFITEFVAALSNDNFAFNNFTFYPNPVKNNLIISNETEIDSIEITSILGQQIEKIMVNNFQTEIDLSQLSNGIYFVKAISEGQEKTIKIVKE